MFIPVRFIVSREVEFIAPPHVVARKRTEYVWLAVTVKFTFVSVVILPHIDESGI